MFSVENFSKKKAVRIAVIAIGIAFCIGMASLIPVFKGRSPEENTRLQDSAAFAADVSAGKIAEGPLSLEGTGNGIPDLSREVIVLAGKPNRSEGHIREILLYLKSSGEEKKIKEGEPVFLGCDSLPGGFASVYRFREDTTPLQIMATVSGENTAALEAKLSTFSPEAGEAEEKTKCWIVPVDSGSGAGEVPVPSFVAVLRTTKILGPDVVISRFLSDTYPKLKDKIRAETEIRGRKYRYFLKQGDVFRLQEGIWVPAVEGELSETEPIASVKSIGPKSVTFDVWDPGSFRSFSVSVDSSPVPSVGNKPEYFPNSVRYKGNKRVLCTLGKRKYFLQEGDWVVKTDRGFRRLHTQADKDRYARYKISGELIIFDSLVTEQGKTVMKGFLVDEMRTRVYPFSCPVTLEIKRERKRGASEKDPFSGSSSRKMPITYLLPEFEEIVHE